MGHLLAFESFGLFWSLLQEKLVWLALAFREIIIF